MFGPWRRQDLQPPSVFRHCGCQCRAVIRDDTECVRPSWHRCFCTGMVTTACSCVPHSTAHSPSWKFDRVHNEEKGLTKTLRDVFSKLTHLLCVEHLCVNIVNYMRNKCGVQQSVCKRLIAKMFDDCGLINANDSLACTRAAEALAMECESVSATLHSARPASRRACRPHCIGSGVVFNSHLCHI